MISDAGRRKIVARLRNLAHSPEEIGIPEHTVIRALGMLGGFYDDCCKNEDVLALADLIDRPTCHISETDHEFEDSVRCDRCQMTFNRPWEPFKFCPSCGAEVVEDAQ